MVGFHYAAVLLALSGGPAPPDRDHCAFQPGGPGLVIRAAILTPKGVLPAGEVLIGPDGHIACVARKCERPVKDPPAELDCGRAVLSPGFINPHDHIDFNTVPPISTAGERFSHRHEWRLGLNGHTRLENFTKATDPRAIAWSELRQLVGGTTSVVGSAMAPGLLRNLDVADGLEGLDVKPVTYRTFPLGDSSGILRVGDCDYGVKATTRDEVMRSSAYIGHVAEGTSAAARNEFICESSGTFDTTPLPEGGGVSQDWLLPQAALVHALALTPRDLRRVGKRHASIVWSPRSNLALYGQTLDVEQALRAKVNVALGTDWLPSGSMSMNRELACARRYGEVRLHGRLSDKQLWRMATINAARVTRTDKVIGAISVGRVADLALFARTARDPYASVVRATPQSTLAVLTGGKLVYGDVSIAAFQRPECSALPSPLGDKRLCTDKGAVPPEALIRFGVESGFYGLAFDGAPPNEPSCEPVS